MTGPDADLAARLVERREERQADDMVEMRVGEEDVGMGRQRLHQLLAEGANAGAGIEDQHPIAATDFDTAGVAAVARIVGAAASNRAADPPEANGKLVGRGQS
jgi:hypothetical protein